MNILRQASMLVEWDPEVKQVCKVHSRTTDHDEVSVSASCKGVIARAVLHLRGMVGGGTNTVYSR